MALAFIDFYWDAVLHENLKVQNATKTIIENYEKKLNSKKITQKISEIIHFENYTKMSKKLSFGILET